MSHLLTTPRDFIPSKTKEGHGNKTKRRDRPKLFQSSDSHRPDYRPHVDLTPRTKKRPTSFPEEQIKENEEEHYKENWNKEQGNRPHTDSDRETGKHVKSSKIPRHRIGISKLENSSVVKGQIPVRINDQASNKLVLKQKKMSGKNIRENQMWTESPRSEGNRSRRQQYEINVEITPHPKPRAFDQLENGQSPRGTPGSHRPSRNQYMPSQFSQQEGRGTHTGNQYNDPQGLRSPVKHHSEGPTSGESRGPRDPGNNYNVGPIHHSRSSQSSHTDSGDSLSRTSRNKSLEPSVQYVMKSKGNSRSSSTSKAPDPNLPDFGKQASVIRSPSNFSQGLYSADQYHDSSRIGGSQLVDRNNGNYQKNSDYSERKNLQQRYVDENVMPPSRNLPKNNGEMNEIRSGKSVQFSDDLNENVSRTSNHSNQGQQQRNVENSQRNYNSDSNLVIGHNPPKAPTHNQSYPREDQPMQDSNNMSVNNPNSEYKFPDSEEEDDQLDLGDIDSVYEGNDAYLCYLMTDDGGMAGPLRLDINDVQVGLPSQVGVKDDEQGMRNRQTGSHGLNEFSSRSHSMLTLTIDTEQQDPDDENLYLTKRGKLTFVDLAGSEKVKDSESSDMTLKESNNINRSLLVLGNCISSLGDPKKRQGHIPYRDSKLTKLLADSLGGNGVTLMIACVTPSSHHVHETINTLRYASRAKKIKTKPIVKMDPREKLILSLKREIKILRNENGYLRQQLEFPAKPKGELQKSNDEKFMKFLKTQGKETNDPKTNVKGGTEEGLYEMLQEYMIENESLRTENSEMHQAKDKVKREQQLMYRENERLTKVIEKLEREINGRSGGGNGGWQRQPNGPPPQRQVNGPPPPRQVNGPPPPRQSGGPPPHQNLPPEQYYDQGPPPPRQGGNKPPPNNQWKGTPPQRPINNRPPPDQYIPGPSPQAGRGKQSTPPGGPKRPPHRLADPIARTANIPPEYIQNGIGGYPDDGYMSPRGRPSPLHNGPIRQDSIRSMNAKLKQEIYDLEGEIEHHHNVNQRAKSIYGSQASMRSGPR
ncbi:uncharacterized protein LOC128187081 isoform X5 [Crassostrea angulata]|uniref:uncharacterized protein LOC128187081 isoform X5 n=1 Tax=Magallana angulata TaxID=2784310 RepID=UPI0022B08742|nr:uncharacterized protein LOC128187081 isoform X5 [Crassostrea angulata]